MIRRLSIAMVMGIIASLLSSGQVLGAQAGDITASSENIISILRSYVHNAREVLETQGDLSENHKQQVYLLAGILGETEQKLEDIENLAFVGSSRRDSSPVLTSAALDGRSRIALIGAKALTEFKAEQLSLQLEKLTKGGVDRQAALEKAVEKAEALSEEVAKLKRTLEQNKRPGDMKFAEKNAQTALASQEKSEWSSRSFPSGQKSSEMDEPFVTIMKASAEAGPLKTNRESVSGTSAGGSNLEANLASEELKSKMEEATKQAKVLQQLFFEIIQKTETIKTREKQTDSKLNDMRQLTKTWEEKKIPVNKEAMALEKKLSNDMEIYQETLKDVDKLKQFLRSMFIGSFRTGPEK